MPWLSARAMYSSTRSTCGSTTANWLLLLQPSRYEAQAVSSLRSWRKYMRPSYGRRAHAPRANQRYDTCRERMGQPGLARQPATLTAQHEHRVSMNARSDGVESRP